MIMTTTKSKPRRFSGCLIKHFPRVFQFSGQRFEISADQKKYLNNPLNVIFLEGENHPVALDRSGNCVATRNRTVQQTFSQALARVSKGERAKRTLKRLA